MRSGFRLLLISVAATLLSNLSDGTFGFTQWEKHCSRVAAARLKMRRSSLHFQLGITPFPPNVRKLAAATFTLSNAYAADARKIDLIYQAC